MARRAAFEGARIDATFSVAAAVDLFMRVRAERVEPRVVVVALSHSYGMHDCAGGTWAVVVLPAHCRTSAAAGARPVQQLAVQSFGQAVRARTLLNPVDRVAIDAADLWNASMIAMAHKWSWTILGCNQLCRVQR
jgi:hypothetical protein